jgi:hypothetical protein
MQPEVFLLLMPSNEEKSDGLGMWHVWREEKSIQVQKAVGKRLF